MKYAVFSHAGKQYKVSEGDEVLLPGSLGSDPKDLELSQILLVSDEEKVKIGTPLVTGAKIACEILGEEKGKKIEVFKYKAKSRYRKHTGHRSLYTRVRVQKITHSSKD
ncbi:MAG: 50S ribosomal protein L21 [Candidatus Blackburnbacteria bacterium]|nr:50S ribosomal protein L21 [Candidatus Blackburnbacteria bacterium]